MAEGHAPYKFTQKLKTEDDSMSEENHSHTFILKFHNSDKTYTIHCDCPQTVLEAIKCKVDVLQELKCEEQRLTVQIGEARLGTAIATHFPCICLQDGELVTLAANNEVVEHQGTFNQTVIYSELYYVLFIKTEGGLNAKTKSLFSSSSIKKFTQVCVYGTKGMTIRDAITCDGRFRELKDFKLEDVSKDKSYVFSDDKIEAHENKTFRICFEKMIKPRVSIKLEKQNTEQKSAEKGEAQDASGQTQGTAKIPPRPQDTEKFGRLSEILKRKETKSENVQEIYQLLQKQFPDLKKIMEDRFPEDTLEETLEKVDFGKAQQSFSDVFRLKKLLKLGESVGKLVVGNGEYVGTAFVLCHHYIITNAHLFVDVVDDNSNLDPNVEVSVLFNYINPILENTSRFIAHKMIDFDREQDYAVLELQVSDQDKVPPGLMKLFCPMPENGEACIIGHPGGEIQRIDPTCIIENKSRSQEVHKYLERFKDNVFAHMTVSHLIEKQSPGISRILSRWDPMYNSVSYHTFMYHGSSGSPVFDAQCRVFGLHSGGFVYGLRPKLESVIEFSHPLLLIFEKFVISLNNRNQDEVLSIVKEHSKRNSNLKKILRKILGSANLEPMDTN